MIIDSAKFYKPEAIMHLGAPIKTTKGKWKGGAPDKTKKMKIN